MNDSAAHPAPVVDADQLVKRFGDTVALDQLSLRIRPRGITAILGANGAGKTTFIRCVLGLTRPDEGALRVFGQTPGSDISRGRTGVMLQDADLPDLLTAREHLSLFASYYPAAMSVAEAIDACDIAAFADARYKTLSGGQKRRVQFALAVIGRPSLLFLDEPTTGLDGDARRALWSTVRQLADNGTAIVLTTHYLEEADALADHIVILKDGRVLTEAPTQDIRNAVGGALIRCTTTVSETRAGRFVGVRSARMRGRYLELLTRDAPATLAELLAEDAAPQDLTVSKPSLEEAVA
ncbi:MAG: ABC transporter ATP-binding protein, partial [Pseudomonadota bacterium]